MAGNDSCAGVSGDHDATSRVSVGARARRSPRHPLLVLAALLGLALAVATWPGVAATRALFVAIASNPGNAFGVPAVLAATGVGATPQAGGKIRVEWVEPGAVTPVATSWAGAYLVYRSVQPVTPVPGVAPYATVISDGTGRGTFIDGMTSVAAGGPCTSSPCTVENVRYYYWVRALSRQTGYPSPLISAGASAAADRSPPSVLKASPQNGTSAVPLGTNVQVTFSEPVDLGSATAAACVAPVASPTQCVPVTANQARWSRSSGVLLELKPSQRLAQNTAYSVSFVATGTFAVRDLAGNAMGAATAASFTTEVPASTVAIRWRSPAVNSQEYMPASGPVVGLTFAEPMDEESVTAAFKTYYGAGCSGEPIGMTAAWNASGNAVAFSPAAPLSTGMAASPTFGVHSYSMRLNDGGPPGVGTSASGHPAAPIACANGTFTPSASVLAFDLADLPSGSTVAAPNVVAGETIALRSVSGPWRQGSYVTLRSLFDEPRSAGTASGTFVIGGDAWSGLALPIPADASAGRHFLGVQNDAIASEVGQDARTAIRAVTVVDPLITVATFDTADPSETSPRTALSPLPGGDTVRVRVQVTAPGRDGQGIRPVAGMPVTVTALPNPTSYGAVLCATLASSSCSGTATELVGTTDAQGIVRGYLTAPAAGAPFNTVVLLARGGSEWGSVVLVDPAPSPPTGFAFQAATGRFSWTGSTSRGVAGYRVHLVPLADRDSIQASGAGRPVPGAAVEVVIDAGPGRSVGLPSDALVAGTTYRAIVVAYDTAGRASSASEPVIVVAMARTPTPTPTWAATATATSTPTFAIGPAATSTSTATFAVTAVGPNPAASATATAPATPPTSVGVAVPSHPSTVTVTPAAAGMATPSATVLASLPAPSTVVPAAPTATAVTPATVVTTPLATASAASSPPPSSTVGTPPTVGATAPPTAVPSASPAPPQSTPLPAGSSPTPASTGPAGGPSPTPGLATPVAPAPTATSPAQARRHDGAPTW